MTFVPDGEPTLDLNLGREIDLLRPPSTPVAVITNSSRMGQQAVRNDLGAADRVSLKVDAVDESAWRCVNRPSRKLDLTGTLEGCLEFSRSFEGTLITDTMLVAGVNDDESLKHTAEYLRLMQRQAAYLSIPTRPPAKRWVRAPEEATVNRAYQIIETRYNGDTHYVRRFRKRSSSG